MFGRIYQFRIGKTADQRWAFRAEQKNEAFQPVVYRFRQSQAEKLVWRFTTKPPQMELYHEQVLHPYLHRGRRLQWEQTVTDFSFLTRRLFSEKTEQQFSFCDRETQMVEGNYLFSFLLREMGDSALVLLFSFLVREMGEAAKVQDFSFLLRKTAVPETTTDFSFLIRKMLTEDELINFSFIIRTVLQEKTAEWLVQHGRRLDEIHNTAALNRLPDLRLCLNETTNSLEVKPRAVLTEGEKIQERAESWIETVTDAVVDGEKQITLSEDATIENSGKETVLPESKLIEREMQSQAAVETQAENLSTESKVSTVIYDQPLTMYRDLGLDTTETSMQLRKWHNLYCKAKTEMLTHGVRNATVDQPETEIERVISKKLGLESEQSKLNRRIDKKLHEDTNPTFALRKSEKELYFEWMYWLERARDITVSNDESYLSKQQELQKEETVNLAVRLMQEMQYIATNFMLIRDDRWISILDYSRQLRRDIAKDILSADDELYLQKFAWKQVHSKWNPVMTEKAVTRDIWSPEKETKLKSTRVVPVLAEKGTVQARSFHWLNEETQDILAENEKQSISEADQQYGKTDFLQPEQPGIAAETEHFAEAEDYMIIGKNPDQLNFEEDRSAELIQRFWTIAKSGFTDRIVLPDIDYPYKDSPVEFQPEIKHNENWDSVFPNQFYRRIDRHPVSYGSDIGKDEIDVDIAVMVDVINIFILMWFKHVRAFWGWTGSQAVLGMVSGMYEYMTLETTQSQLTAKGAKADYERTFRWLRWEAEAMVLAAKDDMELHGNYYVGLLLEELIAYMENHHFDVMPIFRDVNKMDEWRTLFGSELETDITWVLDKVKGIRHRKLGG